MGKHSDSKNTSRPKLSEIMAGLTSRSSGKHSSGPHTASEVLASTRRKPALAAVAVAAVLAVPVTIAGVNANNNQQNQVVAQTPAATQTPTADTPEASPSPTVDESLAKAKAQAKDNKVDVSGLSAKEIPSSAPESTRSAQKSGRSTNRQSSSGKPSGESSKPTNSKASGQGGSCKASMYGSGQKTANGERFNPSELTAAHKTLPFNSRVKVTNKANGKSVVVRINDRGPFVAGRCLDLSTAAMKVVGGTSAGVITVSYKVL